MLPYTALLLAVPVGLRATCYYFRGFYERRLFGHPRRCVAPEGERWRDRVLNHPWYLRSFYVHRYFFVLSAILMAPHLAASLETSVALWPELRLGNLLQWLDFVFLSLYVFSCHSFRYLLGSGVACRSCMSAPREEGLRGQSRLNRLHGVFFWVSLGFLGLYAGFAWLHGLGLVTDLRIL